MILQSKIISRMMRASHRTQSMYTSSKTGDENERILGGI